MSSFAIRLATAADLPAIHDIYNHYVLHSTATYQTIPDPLSAREAWFHSHGPSHPITVATTDQNQILAWASLSPFHPRAAYSKTVEDSIYVHPHHHRQGLGSALLADLLTRAQSLGHHTVIALISADQTPSLLLHTKHGFTPAGQLHQVGHKFNRWLDVAYLQKIL
ncbi:MAG TPA: GNAT family N-acetyltransferase [Tepidisphaeraceae bacterium]|jgi:phosphinothricin acetyltransferase|nr:GNAT family N-acetyltransferase [Tepidisphaeraceae bacterium]